MAKRGLGKGLNNLIPGAGESEPVKEEKKENKVEEVKSGEVLVRTALIEPNRKQPRKNFDEEAIAELAASIENVGLIQPIIVRKKGSRYEIVAGERRWRAAKYAKIKEVPVIIKDYTEQEIMEVALIENIQRENLNPVEEARAYELLIQEYDLKQEELATRLAKSRSTITNSMRLLKLCPEVLELLEDGHLSAGHARALLAIEDWKLQKSLADQICLEKLSVRETEKLVKKALLPNPSKKEEKDAKEELLYKELSGKITTAVGSKVQIRRSSKGKGKIEISYYSEEELERISDILLNNK